MQACLFIVYTPKSLGSGMDHSRLEAAGWSGSCVAPVGMVGCVAPECWLTCERTRGWFHAQITIILHPRHPPPPTGVSGIHGPTAGHSIGRPFATKAPFSQQNRMPVSQAEFAICAASTDLRLKLINPGRAPVTINCTSQSCIFK